jgi:expansin (peptidoglycan-binding protein)
MIGLAMPMKTRTVMNTNCFVAFILLAAACGTPSTHGSDGGPTGPNRTIGDVQMGVATYYAATGEGNCSYEASPGDLNVAAMNESQYANSEACGACVRVMGPNGSVTVRIVDRCPECLPGQLDLSMEAFAQIAEPSQGRVPITWQEVTCGVEGNVSYRFKEGSSQWWVAIQPRNYVLPIRSLEAMVNGSWVALERQQYNYFVAANGLGVGPFTLRVTAVDGQQIVDMGIALQVGQVVEGTQQFR